MQKKSISNDTFKTLRNESEGISRKHVDEMVDTALKRLKPYLHLKLATAWSGGKDSIALEFITRLAGVKLGVLGICYLEYPEFERWLLDNLPKGFEVYRTRQDTPWLLKNRHMLFPDSQKASQWFTIVQRVAQMNYCKKYGIDMILLGRRREDGNRMDKDGMLKRGSQVFFSPLMDWTHQDVFALIHHYSLPMPPIYSWPNGYVCGTHPWPARQHCKTSLDGWKEIYSIDKSIVERMVMYFDEARQVAEAAT